MSFLQKGNLKSAARLLIYDSRAPDPKTAYKHMALGATFLLFSLIMPRIIEPYTITLVDDLSRSILENDVGLLLLCATKLVFFNTLRHFPVITGAFLLGEGVSRLSRIRLLFFASLLLIPVFFRAISIIYDIQFIFSGSIFVTLLVIISLYFLMLRVLPVYIKLLIVNLFLFGFDWLEVVPFLKRIGYGGGEIAQTIQSVSSFIDADYVLNYVGLTVGLMIIINASILTKVIIDYFGKTDLMEKLRITEMEALRARYFQEIRHLVHDLKTPLVTIHGLNDVINMKADNPKVKNYTEKISGSVEQISKMISEILYEDRMYITEVSQVTDYLKTTLALEDQQDRVDIELLDDGKIKANKYLLCRVLTNLVDNSLKAIDPENGLVNIRVWKNQGHFVFAIEDNGRGMSQQDLKRVWDLGFSSKGSTGLGLNFVREVVENHGGKISFDSKLGRGTVVKISIAEVKDGNEESTGS